MTRIFLTCLLLVAVAVVPAIGAAEQATPEATPTPANETDPCTVTVASDLSICSSTVEDGSAVLVIRADHPQEITVSEAATSEGKLGYQEFDLQEGRNRIRLSLRQGTDTVGVVIASDEAPYAHIIETESQLIGPPWGPTDAQLSAIGAALSVSSVVLYLVLKVLIGKRHQPERIA
jgi:hypothetical protein